MGKCIYIVSVRYSILCQTLKSNLVILGIPINLFTLSNYRVKTEMQEDILKHIQYYVCIMNLIWNSLCFIKSGKVKRKKSEGVRTERTSI